MGFDDVKNDEKTREEHHVEEKDNEKEEEAVGKLSRQLSQNSLLYTTADEAADLQVDVEEEDDNEEEEEEEEEEGGKIQLGPQLTLKQLQEKDKDDESLRRWKEQLLGSVDVHAVGESLDPKVRIMSLAIKSPGRSDIILPINNEGNPGGTWFVLKEGSRYSLKFTFQVCNNIVSGLKYTNTVWKTGIKVESTKQMIGTFSPQLEPYTHEMNEETTPSGIFARGSYSARTKFVDDDNKCYLEINYVFEIKKDWKPTL